MRKVCNKNGSFTVLSVNANVTKQKRTYITLYFRKICDVFKVMRELKCCNSVLMV